MKALPCPFCGGRPSQSKGKQYKTNGLWHMAGMWIWKPSIGCKRCKFQREFDKSFDDAIEWWNNRKQL